MSQSLDAVVASISRSGVVNIVLWIGSALTGTTMVGWVLFAGPVSGAKDRAQAIESLWPLVSSWVIGLAAKSKITGDQKTAVVAAASNTAPVPTEIDGGA